MFDHLFGCPKSMDLTMCKNVAARLRPNLTSDVCESSVSMAAMAIRCFLCTIMAVFAIRSKAPEEIWGAGCSGFRCLKLKQNACGLSSGSYGLYHGFISPVGNSRGLEAPEVFPLFRTGRCDMS